MAELKRGQKIIFKLPKKEEINVGIVFDNHIIYVFMEANAQGTRWVPIEDIAEWCDAAAGFQAWALQMRRTGNFEWSQPENGPTVEPIK